MAETKPKEITVIGPDAKFKGEMSFDGTARVLGSFEGTINAGGDIEIGPTAKCKAAIDAGQIVLDGVVEGNVTGREKVQLSANAKLHGDLIAKTLVIAEGAAFVGHCRVGPDAANGVASTVEAKSTSSSSSSSSSGSAEKTPAASKK
jgi:cytoskeletal protein CcmA (bactofilin family)